jgi:hypothetical protein
VKYGPYSYCTYIPHVVLITKDFQLKVLSAEAPGTFTDIYTPPGDTLQ